MREIPTGKITETVRELFLEAAFNLGPDVLSMFRKGVAEEESPVGREIFNRLLENADIAATPTHPPLSGHRPGNCLRGTGPGCAHCGWRSEGGRGRRRPSGLSGRLFAKVRLPSPDQGQHRRQHPAVIHLDVVPGDHLKLIAVPKGGGSENMSRVFMLKPADGWAGIKERVVLTVSEAGPNPCPPIILGVAVGGSFELAAREAKKALLRPLGTPNPDPELVPLEEELLQATKDLGIGPMGLGGRMGVLAVHLKLMPCHIASLPLAVNVQCHSSRHGEAIL